MPETEVNSGFQQPLRNKYFIDLTKLVPSENTLKINQCHCAVDDKNNLL